MERGFSNSIAAGAYRKDTHEQLAVARVVTDQATFAWLCDVFVVDAARGKGIARAMVTTLMDDPRLATLRRWCLPCVGYFELIQPRFGEGPLEDARPPRFANLVGAVFLSAASLAFIAGWDVAGTVLGAIVAVLALLASATGFCAGCEAYKLGCRLTGRPFVSCPIPGRPSA
jgi:predicted GNAT family acetyltransferase